VSNKGWFYVFAVLGLLNLGLFLATGFTPALIVGALDGVFAAFQYALISEEGDGNEDN
jgi:hypothetical protein